MPDRPATWTRLEIVDQGLDELGGSSREFEAFGGPDLLFEHLADPPGDRPPSAPAAFR
ncbi:MAG: hypothetical protein U5K37_11505 [Natrialbaceae archaeon]|nr:hypothetical protein [Natrialbaceae archaeon]